ncbi:MAG: hypothetical protein ACRDHF_14660 [Tepidiformaceae bacterium]
MDTKREDTQMYSSTDDEFDPGRHKGHGALIGTLVALVLLVGVGVYAYQANDEVRTTVDGVVADMNPVEEKVAIPSGTEFAIRLETTLTTKESRVGDHFIATVAEPVFVDGEIVVPVGAEVSGRVILAEQPGKASGRGHLQFAYDELRFDGRSFDLNTQSQVYESESGTGKDAAMIGGGAAGGAIIGGVAGGSAGDAAKGAIIGGAAGTAASLMTRGPQLELPAGTILRFRLDEGLEVVPAEVA